jgi:C4-dicarboxylate transporter, DctQ subunit
MKALRKLGRLWDSIELAIGGLFLSAAVTLVVSEIVMRRFFSHSMVGSDEIAAYAVLWSVLFTASLAVKRNLHVRIDVVFTIVSGRAARYIDAIGTVFSLAFTLFLTWSGWALVQESLMLGEVTMTMLRLPLWIPQMILPIGGLLLSVRLVQRFHHLLFPASDVTGDTRPAPGHSS